MKTSVQWIRVRDVLPDSDMTVLIACPSFSESVWFGYFDEDGWRTVEGVQVEVTHWAELPEGPTAS